MGTVVLPEAAIDVLTDTARFYLKPKDFEFFAELSKGKMKRKTYEKWMYDNEHRPHAYAIGNGLLIGIYGVEI